MTTSVGAGEAIELSNELVGSVRDRRGDYQIVETLTGSTRICRVEDPDDLDKEMFAGRIVRQLIIDGVVDIEKAKQYIEGER